MAIFRAFFIGVLCWTVCMPGWCVDISGTVVHGEETLPEVWVRVLDINDEPVYVDDDELLGTTSESDGTFKLSGVPDGTVVKFLSMGYKTKLLNVEDFRGGGNITVELEPEEVVAEDRQVDDKIASSTEVVSSPVVEAEQQDVVVTKGEMSAVEETSDQGNDGIQAAEDKYKAAKEKEQSLANRMVSGVSMAATGIGGMELAQGLSEQKADKDAEADMSRYIETFQCRIGEQGAKINGGDTNISTPGANQLINLYQEYVNLAADLRERKQALGMRAGIESEVILDKASTGLYDDKGTGIENGTYASLYRASQGNQQDADKLSAQQDASKKRVIGGAVAAGVGVVGGIVGNVFINNKTKVKDLSNDEFNQFVSNQESYQKQMEIIEQCILTNKNNTEDIIKNCIGKK